MITIFFFFFKKKKKNKYHISELNIFFNELEDLDHTLFNEKKIIKKKKL